MGGSPLGGRHRGVVDQRGQWGQRPGPRRVPGVHNGSAASREPGHLLMNQKRGVAGWKTEAHAEISWNWPEGTRHGSGHPGVGLGGWGGRKLAEAGADLPWRDPSSAWRGPSAS